MTNYATRKELEHATSVATSNVSGKRGFITLKAEVDAIDINKLINGQSFWSWG